MKMKIVRIVLDEVEVEISDFVTQAEAACLVGVTASAVRKAMDAGRLPTVYMGKRRGTLKSQVDEWMVRRQARTI